MTEPIEFTIRTNIDTPLFILRDAKHEYDPHESYMGTMIEEIEIFPDTVVIGGCPRGMYHNQIDFVFGLNPNDDGVNIELETPSCGLVLEEMTSAELFSQGLEGRIYLHLPCSDRMKISIVPIVDSQHHRIYIGEVS